MFWLLLACKQPEPAPRDFDAVIHDLWAHYAAQDDAALVVDTVDLRRLVDESELVDGTFSDLTLDEAQLAGAEVDPEPARGMFSVGQVGCTPDEMERVVAATNQDELYPENYVSYERRDTSDREAFEAKDTHHLTWDADYEVDVFIAAYAAFIHGGIHHTPDGDDGPYLYSRTVMPAAADPVQEAVVFDIDYQLEIFYPQDDGMMHVFAMWRHIDLGSGLDTENDGAVRTILNGLHDWDDDTTAICAEGRI